MRKNIRLRVHNKEYEGTVLGDESKIPVVLVGLASNYEHLLHDRDDLLSFLYFILVDFEWSLSNPDQQPTDDEIKGLTLDSYVDNYEYLRKSLGLDKILIMGHSRPAWAAMAYLEKYPQHTLGCLVISCPAIWLGSEEIRNRHSDQFFKVCASDRRTKIYQDKQQSLKLGAGFREIYKAESPKLWHDPALSSPFFNIGQGQEMNEQVFMHFADTVLAAHGAEILQKLPHVKDKIFVIQGLYDYTIPIEDWMSEDAPMQPDYIAVQSGHLMMIEEPNLFVKLVSDWINSLKGEVIASEGNIIEASQFIHEVNLNTLTHHRNDIERKSPRP